MSDPTIIGKIYAQLAGRVRQLDEALIEQYQPAIANIDKLRFDFFKKCVNEQHDSAKCYYEAEKYELKPDLIRAGKQLQECINKAGGRKDWQKAGEACMAAHEKTLRAELQREINRVLKSV